MKQGQFLQLGFEISEDLIYKLILRLDNTQFLLFAFLISALHVYIDRLSLSLLFLHVFKFIMALKMFKSLQNIFWLGT